MVFISYKTEELKDKVDFSQCLNLAELSPLTECVWCFLFAFQFTLTQHSYQCDWEQSLVKQGHILNIIAQTKAEKSLLWKTHIQQRPFVPTKAQKNLEKCLSH